MPDKSNRQSRTLISLISYLILSSRLHLRRRSGLFPSGLPSTYIWTFFSPVCSKCHIHSSIVGSRRAEYKTYHLRVFLFHADFKNACSYTFSLPQIITAYCLINDRKDWKYFRRLLKIGKSDYYIFHVCPAFRLTARPPAWNNSAPTARIFEEFDIWLFSLKSARKLKVSLKSDKE